MDGGTTALMDVLQVNKFYHPVVGGIEHVVRQLATGLSDQGIPTSVLTARQRGFGKSETVDDIPVTRTSSLGITLSTPLAPTFPVRLRQLSSDADLVHYHLPNPIAVASYLTTQRSSPVVVTYHSDIVRQAKALRIYKPLLDRFLSEADQIVTTSPRLRDNSEHLQPYVKKTDVIPISIDIDQADCSTGTSREGFSTDETPTVLFVGRLNYYKGVEYLLDAMAMIEESVNLRIVGDGALRSDLEQRARSLGIDDRVRFLGQVDDETLHACYEAASLFVLPSIEPSEAFGIVQLEAMAHGLPVINTDLPTGVPWVSPDGKTGITVPPRNARALADAIDELLLNSERRDAYSRAARNRVESRFGEEQMIADTIDIYRSIST
jgi:rhamnosyl/mannosyltransferase